MSYQVNFTKVVKMNRGLQGVGIVSATVTPTNELIFTLTNGTTISAGTITVPAP